LPHIDSGRRLLLKTKISKLDYEYLLEVDWDKFDVGEEGSKDLETVGVNLTRQKPIQRLRQEGSGTRLIIYGSRNGFSWDQETVEELHRSIISLNSPNPSPRNTKTGQGFVALLECPQIGTLPSDNPTDVFLPTFSFDGLVDEGGILDYSLKFQPPKTVPMSAETTEEKNYDLRKAKLGLLAPAERRCIA